MKHPWADESWLTFVSEEYYDGDNEKYDTKLHGFFGYTYYDEG